MTNHGRINVAAFSSLMDDLRYNIERNRDSLATALKRSPNMAYKKVNELALFVGSRHNVNLQLHFPAHNKLSDIGSYGTERSEEHTSELQSHSDLVCRLLLEKKKKKMK